MQFRIDLVKIDSVSDVKEGQYGFSSKIKCGNASYFVNQDASPLVGKTVEMTAETKTSAKGNTYRIAKIVKVLDGVPVPATQPSSNGQGVRWIDYATMAKLAHEVAMGLESDRMDLGDGRDPINVDRSTARIAFVNTVMIAFTNGKITLAEGEDDIPFAWIFIVFFSVMTSGLFI